MKKTSLTLITIFTEAALETQLIGDLAELGAPGYTITNARGKGSSGARAASWEANSNIRVEVFCEEYLADKIAHHLLENYDQNYALVILTNPISVIR